MHVYSHGQLYKFYRTCVTLVSCKLDLNEEAKKRKQMFMCFLQTFSLSEGTQCVSIWLESVVQIYISLAHLNGPRVFGVLCHLLFLFLGIFILILYPL